MRTRWYTATILAAGLLLAAPAHAGEDPMEEAKAHVAQAKVHYALGEFEQSAEEYILVYRIKPIPAILFNIAQAYRQGGKYSKARQFYQSYLRATDDPKVQTSVKKAIKELDELLAKEDKTKALQPTGVTEPPDGSLASRKDREASSSTLLEPPSKPPAKKAEQTPPAPAKSAELTPPAPAKVTSTPPAPDKQPASPPATVAVVTPPAEHKPAARPPPPASPPPSKPAPVASVATRPTPQVSESGGHTLAWVVGGTAVALLGGGAFFAVSAASTDSQVTAGGHTRPEVDDLIAQSKSKHMLGAILLGAGVAAAAGATVLFLLPSSSGGSAGVQGRF